ncbi:glyoxalase family protein [Seiridium cupressi]
MDSIIMPKINLERIAHVYYTHKDIHAAQQFLEDFGLEECKRVGNKTYYKGYGREPFLYCATEGAEAQFGGVAFVVETIEDLELAAKTIPGASEISEMSDAPGGGKRVTFHDPADGFPFHLVFGQTLLEEETVLPELELNFVLLLSINWAISACPKAHVHHSSFETHDFDSQVLGHDWLRTKGYENCWGVGRHVMGSQIFDYWFDTSRFIVEHYADGDLCDDTQETVVAQASEDNLHVWGPDLPPTFLA